MFKRLLLVLVLVVLLATILVQGVSAQGRGPRASLVPYRDQSSGWVFFRFYHYDPRTFTAGYTPAVDFYNERQEWVWTWFYTPWGKDAIPFYGNEFYYRVREVAFTRGGCWVYGPKETPLRRVPTLPPLPILPSCGG